MPSFFQVSVILNSAPVAARHIVKNPASPSAFPFSACFFCGGAGPESVVGLKFKKNGRKFKTDERHTLRGIMKLNADNIYELNYNIESAEIAEE